MDYYAKQQRKMRQAQRRDTIKAYLTAVAILPVLWIFAIVFLSI